MTALLWKDYRLNRLLLGFGLLMLAIPLLIGVSYNLYLQWRYDESWWTQRFWQGIACASLGLSLFTFAMLGASAIAAERADRSAEFLAYLPASRRAIITSKAIIAIGAGLFIWIVNLVLCYVVAPHGGGGPEDAMARSSDALTVMIPPLAATSVLLFGAGWFWSSFMPGHAISTGLSFSTLAFVGCSLGSWEYLSGSSMVEKWYVPICLTLGIIGFVAGTVCYLRRVEP